MRVDGITTKQVKSHMQKYKQHLVSTIFFRCHHAPHHRALSSAHMRATTPRAMLRTAMNLSTLFTSSQAVKTISSALQQTTSSATALGDGGSVAVEDDDSHGGEAYVQWEDQNQPCLQPPVVAEQPRQFVRQNLDEEASRGGSPGSSVANGAPPSCQPAAAGGPADAAAGAVSSPERLAGAGAAGVGAASSHAAAAATHLDSWQLELLSGLCGVPDVDCGSADVASAARWRAAEASQQSQRTAGRVDEDDSTHISSSTAATTSTTTAAGMDAACSQEDTFCLPEQLLPPRIASFSMSTPHGTAAGVGDEGAQDQAQVLQKQQQTSANRSSEALAQRLLSMLMPGVSHIGLQQARGADAQQQQQQAQHHQYQYQQLQQQQRQPPPPPPPPLSQEQVISRLVKQALADLQHSHEEQLAQIRQAAAAAQQQASLAASVLMMVAKGVAGRVGGSGGGCCGGGCQSCQSRMRPPALQPPAHSGLALSQPPTHFLLPQPQPQRPPPPPLAAAAAPAASSSSAAVRTLQQLMSATAAVPTSGSQHHASAGDLLEHLRHLVTPPAPLGFAPAAAVPASGATAQAAAAASPAAGAEQQRPQPPTGDDNNAAVFAKLLVASLAAASAPGQQQAQQQPQRPAFHQQVILPSR